jgi:sensor histidine kinase regulating citrate/malate metabolism
MLLPTAKRAEQALRSQEEKHQAARQYAMQEEYYQQLLEKQNQTRALWHDLNKYLRAAKAETAPSEALEQLQSMLDDATAIVDVGNPVVNVILNEYVQSAKALGIELRLKVQLPERLGISAADLYILIGNTMDNAIEACRALPQSQRFIELILRTHQDILYYKLANSYDGTTRRPNDAMRGHGLENVRRCVEQYGGQLLTQQDQGFFIVSAHMNQLPNSET